jgi:hypothetical protein
MQQRYQTFGPAHSDISEILHVWNSALTIASASREADLHAAVVALVMESLDRYITVYDLIRAY